MLTRALAITALSLFLGLGGPALAKQPTTDKNVADAIDREYISDAAIPWNRLDVEVNDGVVTLTGKVTNLLARERATRIAETVRGVRAVVNRIIVRPSGTDDKSDSELRAAVDAALLTDPATDSYEVTVEVKGATATLTGSVDSWTEKQLCETVAKGVNGIKGLQNDLTVAYDSDRVDSEIQNEIERALHWNTLVDDGLIDVKVEDGKVSLSGTVGSAAEKRRARWAAWTAGVQSVNSSELEVRRWARDDDLRDTKYVARPDEKVEQAVKDALLYDPRVLSFNVDVQCHNGIVTLRGVVDNLKASRAAAMDASNTVGVHSVNNLLKVRPVGERSSQAIESDIASSYTRDPYVQRDEVQVSVRDGIAYLNGIVDSYYEKGHAEDLATRVNGVEAVVNNLDVRDRDPIAYDPYVDTWLIDDLAWYDFRVHRNDSLIARKIENELFWSPFVDSDQVGVQVENGVVTLTGSVDSLSEKATARHNAYEGGAIYVRNLLKVD